MTTEGASEVSGSVAADGDQLGKQGVLQSAAPASPLAAPLAPCKSLTDRPPATDGGVAIATNDDEVDRRKALSAAAGRDWGRADSAFTFRGHAGSAVSKAGEKRPGTGNEGAAWPAPRVSGHAGSAADLTVLSGATPVDLRTDLTDPLCAVRRASFVTLASFHVLKPTGSSPLPDCDPDPSGCSQAPIVLRSKPR